jgi:hypothetical protein
MYVLEKKIIFITDILHEGVQQGTMYRGTPGPTLVFLGRACPHKKSHDESWLLTVI